MTKPPLAADGDSQALFYEVLRKSLKKRKTSIESICPSSDAVSRRVLEDYGAIFLADKKVLPPPVCVFTSDEQVVEFQERAGYTTEFIAYDEVELQPEAMKQLLKARAEAQKENLDITPRDGAEAGRRSFEDSLQLWHTRFQPALDHWLAQGRLTEEQVARLKSLPMRDQIAEVLELERAASISAKIFPSRSCIRLPRPARRSTSQCSLLTLTSLTIRGCGKFWLSTAGFRRCLAICPTSPFSA